MNKRQIASMKVRNKKIEAMEKGEKLSKKEYHRVESKLYELTNKLYSHKRGELAEQRHSWRMAGLSSKNLTYIPRTWRYRSEHDPLSMLYDMLQHWEMIQMTYYFHDPFAGLPAHAEFKAIEHVFWRSLLDMEQALNTAVDQMIKFRKDKLKTGEDT